MRAWMKSKVLIGMMALMALGTAGCDKLPSGPTTRATATHAATASVSASSGNCGQKISVPSPAGRVPTTPTLMMDVPGTLPPNGVTVHYYTEILAILLPLASEKVRIARDQAIAIAMNSFINEYCPYPPTAVLANFTSPAVLSGPDVPKGQRFAIENVPAWVVTFTFPAPENVAVGGYSPAGPPVALASHNNLVINAQTGAVVWEFFTR